MENLSLRVQEKYLKVIKGIKNNFKTKVSIVSVVNQIFNNMLTLILIKKKIV
jgi:hypothetical protein